MTAIVGDNDVLFHFEQDEHDRRTVNITAKYIGEREINRDKLIVCSQKIPETSGYKSGIRDYHALDCIASLLMFAGAIMFFATIQDEGDDTLLGNLNGLGSLAFWVGCCCSPIICCGKLNWEHRQWKAEFQLFQQQQKQVLLSKAKAIATERIISSGAVTASSKDTPAAPLKEKSEVQFSEKTALLQASIP